MGITISPLKPWVNGVNDGFRKKLEQMILWVWIGKMSSFSTALKNDFPCVLNKDTLIL